MWHATILPANSGLLVEIPVSRIASRTPVPLVPIAHVRFASICMSADKSDAVT